MSEKQNSKIRSYAKIWQRIRRAMVLLRNSSNQNTPTHMKKALFVVTAIATLSVISVFAAGDTGMGGNKNCPIEHGANCRGSDNYRVAGNNATESNCGNEIGSLDDCGTGANADAPE
jgi:hypothetical protein